jgi:hypothetical protein
LGAGGGVGVGGSVALKKKSQTRFDRRMVGLGRWGTWGDSGVLCYAF